MSFVCGLNCYFMFVIKRNLLFWWKTPQTPHSLNFKIIYLSSVRTSRLLPIMLHRKMHPRLDMSFKETMHYIWQIFFIIIPNSRVALLFSFLFNTIYYSHKIHLVFVYTYVTVCTVHKVHILFRHMNEKHTWITCTGSI